VSLRIEAAVLPENAMDRDPYPVSLLSLAAFGRCAFAAALALSLASSMPGSDRPAQPWLTGKIVDANRARYLAMVEHNSHSSTTTSGSVSATGQSSTIGGNTTTDINGSYSGTSSTDTSSSDVPLYRVYENLIIEGDDMVYVTRERIRWRWSKGAHVTVNGEVRYYVDKRKLHVLDDDGKEHVVEIAEQIKKDKIAADARKTTYPKPGAPGAATSEQETRLRISSTPDAADIEVDGSFVGNTPSEIEVAPGDHTLTISKAGYKPWERKLKATVGSVSVRAELDPQAK
jgi:hypothetical protein